MTAISSELWCFLKNRLQLFRVNNFINFVWLYFLLNAQVQWSKLLKFLNNIDYRFVYVISIVDNRAARESVYPVLVPKSFEHNWVKLRLKHTVLNFVVLVGMHSKLFKLFALDHFEALRRYFILVFLGIVICKGSETPKLNFACCDCTFGVNNYSDCGVLHQLHCLLGIYINAREPAAVARMRMVPTANEFWSVNLSWLFLVVDLVGLAFLRSINPSFGSNYRQCKYIHDVHRVTKWETL